MKIYTKRGDDGTTGLFYGGRVAKDAPQPRAYGAVDEAQAFIGLVRAEIEPGELDDILVEIARALWVLMAELALNPDRAGKGRPGETLVSDEMVSRLEDLIDDIGARFVQPKEFLIPGQNRVSAALDVARTVTRRAERESIAAARPGSLALPYLNRLSDLLWILARWQESSHLAAKDVGQPGAAGRPDDPAIR
ncbi:cob(I)yrinic acid a,c-diamide adenosyltransferase [Symbioplanes lichenis]|uniref:cob(I)yrinic acid a,c-diamide adenosyltransferase n=1 Tax=Symbioplanes lichenis TaxID=1629072 RepID=UPI002738B144|nr:cob(I)yrinic acid a,c-diamide adenosyltransferase [Actinoplanes lichenis]